MRALVLCAVLFLATPASGDSEALMHKMTISNMKLAVKHIKRQLPKKVDAATTWVNVAFQDPATYLYFYTLDTDRSLMTKDVRDVLKGVLTDQVCTQKIMRPFLDAEGTYVYHYTDLDGRFFFEFAVRKADCDRPGS